MLSKRNVSIIIFVLILSFFLLERSMIKPAKTQIQIKEEQNDIHKGIQTPQNIKEATVLRVATALSTHEFAELQNIAAKYSEHMQLEIELKNYPTKSAYETFQTQIQVGEAPDLLLIPNHWVSEFAARGLLHYVDDYLTTDVPLNIVDAVHSQLQWNGYVWGIPYDIAPYGLAWNKKIFSDLNMTKEMLRGEELIDLIHQIKQEKDEVFSSLYVDISDPFAFISLIWAIGGDWDADESGVLSLADERTTHALNALFQSGDPEADLDRELFSLRQPLAPTTAWRQLMRGDIAIMIAPLTEYKQNYSDEIDVTYIVSDDDTSSHTGGWIDGSSFVISSQSNHYEEAFAWAIEALKQHDQLKLFDKNSSLQVSGFDPSIQFKDIKIQKLISDAIVTGRTFGSDPRLHQRLTDLTELIFEFTEKQLWHDPSSFIEQLDTYWGPDQLELEHTQEISE